MGDLTPALVAIASIVGGIVALSRNLPRVRKLFRVDQAATLAAIRERAELYEAKWELVTADLATERAAHLVTRDALVDEQRSGDRCRRQLADVQEELRAIGRRRTGPR